MRGWVIIGIAALAIAGCTRLDGRPRPIEAEEIRYETSPCFGACPVYAVTIRPDGSGVFEGRRFTAVTGMRTFTADPAAYRRFVAALSPYRPKGERLIIPANPAECQEITTDMSGVNVRWTEFAGAGQHLVYYFGCATDSNRTMLEVLQGAPLMLPIAELIGKR